MTIRIDANKTDLPRLTDETLDILGVAAHDGYWTAMGIDVNDPRHSYATSGEEEQNAQKEAARRVYGTIAGMMGAPVHKVSEHPHDPVVAPQRVKATRKGGEA